MILKNNEISFPLFCAPMAGLTHSAFRRLLSDFGGYGAIYTEMLSSRALLVEDLLNSPFTKKREQEGAVIYQLKLSSHEPVKDVLERLKTIQPFGIDLNLGCPAPEVKRDGSGKALFDNIDSLEKVLESIRKSWNGPFTVKCRLGNNTPDWQSIFLERIRLFEQYSIDAICVHPRFSDEKLKRTARWHLFPWIKSQTDIPIIANGDICKPDFLNFLSDNSCDALMIGRMAVVKPWIFQEFSGKKIDIHYGDIWNTHVNYICEDFPPEKAIGRIKEFTTYYAKNFFFGHELYRRVQSAGDIHSMRTLASDFFSSSPQITTPAFF